MDNQSTPNNKQVNPKPHPLKVLALIEIGILDVGLVLILFLLLFTALNYFNVLPFSDTFPKFLGWLPRRQVQVPQGDALQGVALKNNPINYSPIASPTPQGQFKYDSKKAETLLTQYLKDTIKPEYLPEKIRITQGQQIDGVKSNLPYEFGWYSQGDTASIGATLHFAENTNVIESKEVFMEVNTNNLKAPNITADFANSLLNLYLGVREQIQPSDCKVISSLSYCQVFKQDANGKKGFGIIMLNKGYLSVIPNSHLILFSCSLSKEGNSYKTQQSCLKQF